MNNVLWSPSSRAKIDSKMALFIKYINKKHDMSIDNYSDLHRWSIDNIELFWSSISDFFKIKYSSKAKSIFKPSNKINKNKWFQGASLNYAENILESKDLSKNAIDFFNELGDHSSITYGQLYTRVSAVADLFKKIGVKKGDRIAAMMPNVPETVVSSLASASLGAIWSSCSPDFGKKAIIDRFKQIEPKVLIVCNGYTFKGKKYSCVNRISQLISELDSVIRVIVFNYVDNELINHPKCMNWSDVDLQSEKKEIDFCQMKFEDPLYIMFSSGTTGKPKSIVHSIGGTLIQHIKELGLHTDLNSEDKILYYTTCGWMMWNWVLSSLYFGATLVLYEGNPFYPNIDALLKIVDTNQINVFGTSAKYISHIQSKKVSLINNLKFEKLRTILSTGSSLTEDNFNYIYSDLKSDVQVSSISGGTDIISCFALGNPMLEVVSGELQCIGLGMDVVSFDMQGKSVKNKRGELVCRQPFPSMPIYFWKDLDGDRYFNSYFNKYDNVWTHGDFIEINDRGGAVIYGRSDATLNPGGIRIGTSEIYSAIEELSFLEDAIAVNSVKEDAYILFVKLEGFVELNSDLIYEIRNSIKKNLSPKHLPSDIFSVLDIPYTINGKKVEIAVKNIVNGESIKNLGSISNPECLNQYKDIINKISRFKV